MPVQFEIAYDDYKKAFLAINTRLFIQNKFKTVPLLLIILVLLIIIPFPTSVRLLLTVSFIFLYAFFLEILIKLYLKALLFFQNESENYPKQVHLTLNETNFIYQARIKYTIPWTAIDMVTETSDLYILYSTLSLKFYILKKRTHDQGNESKYRSVLKNSLDSYSITVYSSEKEARL